MPSSRNDWIWMKACQPTPMSAADWPMTSDSRFDVTSHTLPFSRVGVFRRWNWTTDRLKLASLFGVTVWECAGRDGKGYLFTKPAISARDWARKRNETTSCSEQSWEGGQSKDTSCTPPSRCLSDTWWSYELTQLALCHLKERQSILMLPVDAWTLWLQS